MLMPSKDTEPCNLILISLWFCGSVSVGDVPGLPPAAPLALGRGLLRRHRHGVRRPQKGRANIYISHPPCSHLSILSNLHSICVFLVCIIGEPSDLHVVDQDGQAHRPRVARALAEGGLRQGKHKPEYIFMYTTS
jgi:hypothetical protein